jgi:hypothetical protein
MIGKALTGLAAALALLTATMASAAGPGGGVGAMGAMGTMGSMGSFNAGSIGLSGIPRIRGGGGGSNVSIGGAMNGLQSLPFPTNDPNHYHEIKLIGRVAKDENGLTIDQQVVRMRVDGREIPMSINADATSNSLQLDQGDELGQILYRLILSRQLQVVGSQKLRTEIANAASANPSKPILVDGFVYDRMTPYLVLMSVGDAP